MAFCTRAKFPLRSFLFIALIDTCRLPQNIRISCNIAFRSTVAENLLFDPLIPFFFVKSFIVFCIFEKKLKNEKLKNKAFFRNWKLKHAVEELNLRKD